MKKSLDLREGVSEEMGIRCEEEEEEEGEEITTTTTTTTAGKEA